jgi:hypothetical protein
VSEAELQERVESLERLVFALGDKLLILAQHLARLAERKDVR